MSLSDPQGILEALNIKSGLFFDVPQWEMGFQLLIWAIYGLDQLHIQSPRPTKNTERANAFCFYLFFFHALFCVQKILICTD